MAKKKILIIDDESIIALNIRSILQLKDYEVCGTGISAEEAISLTDKHNPDLILMDIILDGEKDGITAVEEIKEKHNIPVVYLTAHSDKMTLQRAKETGPQGYILKPISNEELLATVEIALYKHEIDKNLKLTQFTLDNTRDAVYWMGPDAKFVYVNESACHALGYSREELLTMNVHDIGPEFPAEVWPAHWEDLRKRGSFVIETIHQAKNGHIFPVEISVNYVKQGNQEYNCAIARDISGRKQVEASLHMAQFSVDKAAFEVYWINEDTTFSYVNDEACRALGYTRTELLNLTVPDVDPDFPMEKWEEHWKDLKKQGTLKVETRHRRKDGTVFPVEVIANFLEFQGKKYNFAFSSDITIRREVEEEIETKNSELEAANEELQTSMEELEAANEELMATNEEFEASNEELIATQSELEESEKRYRTLFIEMLDGYALHEIICDDSGRPVDYRFIDINPAFQKLTGLTRDIIGKTVLETMPGTEKHWIETYGEVALTGNPARFENYSKELDKWFNVTTFRPSENQFACIFQDITDRKKADETIKNSLKEKETLISEIHHRVKNNMQVIISLLALQAEQTEDDKVREPLIISENRIRSMALVHEKLYQSKDLANIDFREYVKDLTNSLQHSISISQDKISFDLNISEIYLDATISIPCGLIITELISNSFKHAFTEGKMGKISIDFNKNKTGNYTLTVMDNGIGLTADFQNNKKVSLGYQLVNALTKQLRGEIKISGKKGTRVTITFPGK